MRLLSLAVGCAVLSAGLLACGPHVSLQTCTTSADCPSPQTCVSGSCVNSACGVGAPTCSADTDCSSTQHCAAGCCVAGAPGTCTTNTDCTNESGTPVCDPLTGSCVACVANRDCGIGFTCTNNSCVGTGGCFANSDCKTAADPVCNVNTRTCVQCMASTDCTSANTPVCNADHVCVSSAGCSSDSDCAAPTPRCSTGGACVQCLSTADCANGLTCSVSHTCVQPSATTCDPQSDGGTDSDCASSSATPHCLPGSAGSSSGTCVACVTTDQCPPADICATGNTCQPLRCTGNSDCQNPAAPVCNTAASPPGCVACLQSSDCANGGTCQADHTCLAPVSACVDDSGCASNAADPHCAIVSGGTNKCVACRLTGQCGSSACPNDCGAGQVCGQGNLCVNVSCTSDAQCTDPRRPHCQTGANGAAGTCVQCVSASQCAVGDRCDSDNTCQPICTTATQAQDCPTGTPLCKVSPSGNSCVQCLGDSDCGGSTPTCSSSNSCIATPPTGCQGNSDCPAGQQVCDTATSPHSCVQCLATSDCSNGDLCNTATNTCAPPPEGGEGQACFSNQTCNAGLLCIDEGGASPVCREQCDPTDDTVCASVSASDVCEWLSFDSNGVLIGVCEPGNGNGQTGDACDPTQIDSCEWNLLCAPTSSSGGVCSALCTPGGSCDSGSCNSIVGALSSSGAVLDLGYCGSSSSWGTACVTDTGSAGADCGDDPSLAGSGTALFCTPSTLPAEYPAVDIVGTCQFGPAASSAVGGTDTSCAALGGDDCRTGVCLADGSQTCFAGCRYNADCTRDCTQEGGCATTSDCFAVNYSEGDATGVVGTCEPTCRDDLDCPAGSCQPSPVFGGSSWQAICGPVSGAGKAGSACSGGAACESGVCLTASTMEAIELGVTSTGATATDGICLGACLPSASGDCASGSICSTTAALPLSPINTGDLGVVGKVNPGVCIGAACTSNASCAGLSADASTPRVCAPYKTTTMASVDTAKKCTSDANCTGSSSWVATCNTTANNPNPGTAFGSNAGIFGPNGFCRAVGWSLGCMPSLGAAKLGPGATCTAATDCQTGHCINNGGASEYCYGACASDSDCLNGTTCQSGTYLGLATKHCMP